MSYLKTVSVSMARGAPVAYESTVYPGVTEDICLPILELESGMRCPVDFTIGYSPERVNPGDKEHIIPRVVKIVSGCNDDTLERLAALYGSVIPAVIHKAANIRTAEAAKVIENVQRDLNIALVNELAMIFEHMGIRTRDVIDAAGTKWNFHKYTPGLVGGHCIGVDPYYLTHKAQELGYQPEIILAGRPIVGIGIAGIAATGPHSAHDAHCPHKQSDDDHDIRADSDNETEPDHGKRDHSAAGNSGRECDNNCLTGLSVAKNARHTNTSGIRIYSAYVK